MSTKQDLKNCGAKRTYQSSNIYCFSNWYHIYNEV